MFSKYLRQFLSGNQILRLRWKAEIIPFPVSSFLTDEIDKQKRELLSARQAKETAEHQCITEVLNREVVFFFCFFFVLFSRSSMQSCPFTGKRDSFLEYFLLFFFPIPC